MSRIPCIFCLLISFAVTAFSQNKNESGPYDQGRNAQIFKVSDYNVIWASPSENSLGSMPAGNGDIGINLWAEKNGDLIFYISKTDAWSENARLLKIGKVRVSIFPNPFSEGSTFRQELALQDGMIKIQSGEGNKKMEIDAWVDANNPLIELNIRSNTPFQAEVSSDIWRTEQRKIDNENEIHSAYGLNGADGPVVIVEKDTVLKSDSESLIWAHRNERSIWQDNLKLQGLQESIETAQDPLLFRTFGCMLFSRQMRKVNGTPLKTQNPLTSLSISAIVATQQSETLRKWQNHLEEIVHSIQVQSLSERLLNHKVWWKSFWDRSYIRVTSADEAEQKSVFTVSQGYALQRYMIACSGRGNSPIKFNGSIFTVDTEFIPGKFQGLDADFRQWGGPYWFQNTRLPYWTMLESGDFEMMEPLFKMYMDALPNRKLATKTYYGHDGAFYPETMYFWGTYADANYGRDRNGLEPGLTQNKYIRYYWQGGLELSLMMLDYFDFTQDELFLQKTLIPFASEILTFFDQHWNRGPNGKILFSPSMSLETFHTAVNPLPDIVGIETVANKMLSLSRKFTTEMQREQWKKLINDLPEIPVREADGKKVLSPAAEYSDKANVENPELYAVFPYRKYRVGKPDIDLARNTFDIRLHKDNGGWQQNSIQAACLGLSDDAKKMVIQSFSTWDKNYRFIAFWGPNYDWTPDQDHGSVAMNALQRMILQYDGDSVQLLPSWPKEWDVDFKLHGPLNKIYQGTFKDGKLINQ